MNRPFLTPPRLHAAGAVIRHEGPFSSLNVPVAVTGFRSPHHEIWIQSLYYNAPWSVRQQLVREHRVKVSAKLIETLLAEFDWRARMAGAYMAAMLCALRFRDQIGCLLLRSDVCFAARGYCLTLASFNDEQSRTYLLTYLEYYLHHPELDFDQSYVLETVSYLDEINGTDFAEPYRLIWCREYPARVERAESHERKRLIEELGQIRELRENDA